MKTPGCFCKNNILLLSLLLAACSGEQSALNTAAAEADYTRSLFYVLLIGAAFIWLVLMGAILYAVKVNTKEHSPLVSHRFIVIGGILLPTTGLILLTTTGLMGMTEYRGQAADLSLRITGEQFWWRVEYLDAKGDTLVETANEITLPRDKAAELMLETADVIHSFWVPSLAGKMDMIPGRSNRLVLEPNRNGRYRGQCAEFCGTSHAFMAFFVNVVPQAEFARWIEAQQAPADESSDAIIQNGKQIFLQTGCGACHQVRGTPATGRIGPDLTHLASRDTLAAATLDNDRTAMLRWLRHTRQIKPGVQMPSFAMLSDTELQALTRFLESLQ